MGRWRLRVMDWDAGVRWLMLQRFRLRHAVNVPVVPDDPHAAEAHRKLWAELAPHHPALCPVCVRMAAIYERTISVPQAVVLVRLVQAHLKDPRDYHIDEIIPGRKSSKSDKTSTDASYLRHFGLLRKPKHGWYGAVPDGIDFVFGRLPAVPRSVTLYDNRLIDFSDDLVTIRDVLGNRQAELRRLLAWARRERPALVRPRRRRLLSE